MAHGVHLRSAVSNRRCPVQHPDRHAGDRAGGLTSPASDHCATTGLAARTSHASHAKTRRVGDRDV